MALLNRSGAVEIVRQNVSHGGTFLSETQQDWIAVALGNSRSLWGWYRDDRLLRWQRCLPAGQPDWVTHAGSTPIVLAEVGSPEHRPPLLNAMLERDLSSICVLSPTLVPLENQYESLGLDRSLVLVGAASRWGWPTLVVDGGTALTLSAANSQGQFEGGAILPGLELQGRSLHDYTAALPQVQFHYRQHNLPRWATSTEGAIRSGIYYGALATVQSFISDWRDRYPNSITVFTGGDGELLHQGVAIADSHYDAALILRGMLVCWQAKRHEGISDAVRHE
ncbi:MAG: type III pantothenate kinase [Synechococcus sp.]